MTNTTSNRNVANRQASERNLTSETLKRALKVRARLKYYFGKTFFRLFY